MNINYISLEEATNVFGYYPITISLENVLSQLNLTTGPWIAGGSFVRQFIGCDNEVGNGDIDIFSKDYEMYMALVQSTRSNLDAMYKTQTKNGMIYTDKNFNKDIQIVEGYFHKTLESLFNSFDFHVCQFASDGYTLAYTDEAYDNLDQMKLTFTEKKGNGFFNRLAKYHCQGFDYDFDDIDWAMIKIDSTPDFFTSHPY